MKKLLPFVLALIISTVLTAQIGPPVTSPYLDSCFLTYMETNNIPGISTCMVKDGLIRWIGTYGDANIEQEIPVDTSTLFFLASVSKTVTVTSLMQLWEEDFFDLDDDINEYLDFDVRNPNDTLTPITFRMLCTHTSSIRDNWANMPFYWTGDSPIPLGEYLFNYLNPEGEYYDPGLNFFNETPGTNRHYCNISSALIGYLVEIMGDTSFSVLTQEMLFEPLQMNETGWFLEGLDTMNMAMPYHWSGSEYVPYGHFGISFYPAGQLRTSIDQLGRFLLCYLNEGTYQDQQILQSSTIDTILSPQIPSIDPDQGLIWFSIPAVGSTWWGHGGETYGVTTFMFFSPEYDYGHIILSNGETDVSPLGYILYEYAMDSVVTTCLEEGITFSTQAEIDSFQINYPYCTEIEGDVTIQGEDITNLNGLNVITAIGGSLLISGNESLPNLSGLNNLISIDTNLTIAGNNLLTNMSGLENLAYIGGELVLKSNEALLDLTGLESLTYIEGEFVIGSRLQVGWGCFGNPSLVSLSGLDNITHIGGRLFIRDNNSLLNLTGLENLESIGGSLYIAQNNTMLSLEGLNNLTTIGGYLGIFANESLISLMGLQNLSSIQGGLFIGTNITMGLPGGNPALSSLAGLENIEPESIVDLSINNNESLSNCEVQSICDYLADPNGEIEIGNNATGCNSFEEVWDACWNAIEKISLEDNLTISPNPIESNAIITYYVNKSSHIYLKILDISGRLVVTLVNEFQQQGEHRIDFNTMGLQAGIYFCTLKTDYDIQTKKIIKK